MKTLDWFLLAIGVLLSSLGGIFLKIGAGHIDHEHGVKNAVLQAALQWQLYFGAFCYFIPVVIWIYMLKRVDITFLQPLFALVYVSTPLLASYFLQAQVSPMRWFGIAIIMMGIVVVART